MGFISSTTNLFNLIKRLHIASYRVDTCWYVLEGKKEGGRRNWYAATAIRFAMQKCSGCKSFGYEIVYIRY